jgi:hypothetical protein
MFDDGVTVLTKFGPGRCWLRIGDGVESTQEFFRSFTEELLSQREIWNRGTLGLFPNPFAAPSMLYLTGILCAKALAQDCVIDIPLNPVFVEIAREQVNDKTLSEIDPDYAKLLDDPGRILASGHKFEIPGKGELKPGGSRIRVTNENVNEFIELFKERTLCKDLAAEFRRGFGEVIPWEGTYFFTPREFIEVLKRENAQKITE